MCQTACLDQTRLPDAVKSPAFCSLRQTSLRLQRSRPIQEKICWTTRAWSAFGSNRALPPPSLTETYRYPNGAQDMTFREPLCAACRLPRRLRSMNLARSYSAIMPCIWSNRSSSGPVNSNLKGEKPQVRNKHTDLMRWQDHSGGTGPTPPSTATHVPIPPRCGRRSLGRYAESSPDFGCRGKVRRI